MSYRTSVLYWQVLVGTIPYWYSSISYSTTRIVQVPYSYCTNVLNLLSYQYQYHCTSTSTSASLQAAAHRYIMRGHAMPDGSWS